MSERDVNTPWAELTDEERDRIIADDRRRLEAKYPWAYEDEAPPEVEVTEEEL